jgi:hypothetical protein
MVALVFKVTSLEATRALLDAAQIKYHASAAGLMVGYADAANVALGFTAG